MMDHLLANELLDIYGPLLTDRQQQICQLYFQDDLSLSEIGQELSISRAAISDALKKAAAAMEGYESRLHLLEKNRLLYAWMEEDPSLKEKLEALLF